MRASVDGSRRPADGYYSLPVGGSADTADADALAGLATQQEAIRSVLPANPNERLVYQCQKAAAGITPAAAP